ncbi:MAG: branched-chain amino acid ABC transporter substrate-binding protein [Desulfobacterales bacterium]|jgi:branched-chain amino acid transport system substrate-binding protein|nr:branched-chain amino acid ABC transporter substrate-binding protein [Desulfobacterales bacterium]
MKKRLYLMVLMPLVALLAGWGHAAETIKIGVVGAHSGDLASYGLPTVNAVHFVLDEVNAKGGILGKQVEMIQVDDACKPEVAANAAQKIVSEKVNAVIGPICSGATKAALGIYRDARIITISPSATNVDLTNSGEYPNFFRTIAPDDAQARLEVDFAVTHLKLKSLAVIHDKGDYGKGLAEFARGFLEKAGAMVLLFEGVTPGAVDYSAIVQKIRQSGAEGVIYGGYHPEAAKIVMAMRKKKMKTFFISDDGVKDDTFIKVAGKYAEGVYATGPIDTTQSPMAIAAIEQHRKALSADPGAFYLNAHAAIRALLNAMDKAGSTDYDAVAKALRTEWVETPLGKISFDDKGDAEGIGFSMYRVTDGKFETPEAP